VVAEWWFQPSSQCCVVDKGLKLRNSWGFPHVRSITRENVVNSDQNSHDTLMCGEKLAVTKTKVIKQAQTINIT
jgi:hypothetical protein